jgi:murein DD-endopeptidase MepM/ murein hydrolase activator NlpD
MKKTFLLFLFITGSYFAFSQNEKNMVEMVMKFYVDYIIFTQQGKIKRDGVVICPPEPSDFYKFFSTTFIDFRSLREGEKVNSFSFSDSLCSPLTRKLEITSPYGMRSGGKHFGVDFRVRVGDTVRSIFCGKVRVAKYDKTYGYVVVIRNYNMSETVYAHLDKILVKVDQAVEVGQIIGLGGNSGRSSGPHLHFEMRYKGFPINPIVNRKFLKDIPVY